MDLAVALIVLDPDFSGGVLLQLLLEKSSSVSSMYGWTVGVVEAMALPTASHHRRLTCIKIIII